MPCRAPVSTPDFPYRVGRCRPVPNCAAKDEVYFGFKGGLRITDYGLIVHAPLLPAYGHDSTGRDPLFLNSAIQSLDRQQELKQHHKLPSNAI